MFPLEDGQDVYLEVFHTELEAFKHRVKDHTVRCNGKPEPKEAWTALPPVSLVVSPSAVTLLGHLVTPVRSFMSVKK